MQYLACNNMASSRFAVSAVVLILVSSSLAFLLDPSCYISNSPKRGLRGAPRVVLHCYCNFSYNFQWYFRSNTNATEKRITSGVTYGARGADLTLTSLDFKDTGYYTCRGKNFKGEKRDTVFFTVIWQKLKVTSQNVTVNVGDDAELRCDVTGYPEPNYSWFRISEGGGMALVTGGGHRHADRNGTATLVTLKHVQVTDSGTYRCLLSNSLQTVFADVTLQVCTTLTAVHTPSKKVVVEGESVHFECSFRSEPPASYRWLLQRRNGSVEEVPSQLKQDGVSEVHVLNVTSAQHEGTYVCEASNPLHVVNVSATLHVLVPPTISRGPENQTLALNANLGLTCFAAGVPPPVLEWFFQGVDDKALTHAEETGEATVLSSGHALLIKNLTLEHEGHYACRAKNDIGVDVASAFVKVIANGTTGGQA